jgi:hypothetical protein
MLSATKPPRKEPEKPPWTKNVPVNSGKIEKIPLSKLTEAQRKAVWTGIKKLNPNLAEAVKNGETLTELDPIDMLRYYEAGMKMPK